MLWNDPYNRSIDEIRKLTVPQLLTIIRGRNEDGSLKISPPVAGETLSEKGAYFLYLQAIGINDKRKRERLYREFCERKAAMKEEAEHGREDW